MSEHQQQRPPGTFRVGSIGGIDVLVRSSWLLVAALIAITLAPRVEEVQPGLGGLKYVAGAAFAVLLYLSVLLHELSHALMAQRFGMTVSSITLHFLGGMTQIESESTTPGREFWVAFVGPVASIVVGLLALALTLVAPGGLLLMAVEGLAGANLIVGVLNLVPGLPLDGGRVLRAIVWRVTGSPHRGSLAAGWAGRVVALLALLYPVFLDLVLDTPPDLLDYLLAFVIASFLWGGATSAIQVARLRRRLPGLSARQLARRALAVPEDLPVSEAVRRAQEAQAGSLVTTSADGRPVGLVNESSLTATPAERRPWVPVSSLARSLEGGLRLSVDLTGEELVQAMQRTPASEYLLVEEDGSVYGVLAARDVDQAFASG